MGCPVILIFGLYRGGNRYDVHFERLAERITLEPRERQRAIERWVQRYAERLEYYARSAPYNWFNFYDFWASAAVPAGWDRYRDRAADHKSRAV
jgi:predicted LPLAT superfamily acyltransferase